MASSCPCFYLHRFACFVIFFAMPVQVGQVAAVQVYCRGKYFCKNASHENFAVFPLVAAVPVGIGPAP